MERRGDTMLNPAVQCAKHKFQGKKPASLRQGLAVRQARTIDRPEARLADATELHLIQTLPLGDILTTTSSNRRRIHCNIPAISCSNGIVGAQRFMRFSKALVNRPQNGAGRRLRLIGYLIRSCINQTEMARCNQGTVLPCLRLVGARRNYFCGFSEGGPMQYGGEFGQQQGRMDDTLGRMQALTSAQGGNMEFGVLSTPLTTP